MLAIYVDDAGINYKKNTETGFYNDGPYNILAGILINDRKYFHLERLFCELIKSIGVEKLSGQECHATDIWHREGGFADLTEAKVKVYFNELFQLLAKFNVPIVVALSKKEDNQNEEFEKCSYSFLHGIEYVLSEFNETGVLIFDKGNSKSEVIDNLLFERTKWRNFDYGTANDGKSFSKYKFEGLSCFLLDCVHYAESSKILYLMIADHVAFVLQRVFAYVYLKHNKSVGINIVADKNKVPIEEDSFRFNLDKMFFAHFDEEKGDVMFDSGDYLRSSGVEYLPPQLIFSIKK